MRVAAGHARNLKFGPLLPQLLAGIPRRKLPTLREQPYMCKREAPTAIETIQRSDRAMHAAIGSFLLQGSYMCHHAFSQTIQPVTAFQYRYETPLTELFGERDNGSCNRRKPCRRNIEDAQ